jgi:hypothetical protein
MEYEDIRTTAGKLLQYVRSMPAVTCALVGQKVRELQEGCCSSHTATCSSCLV